MKVERLRDAVWPLAVTEVEERGWLDLVLQARYDVLEEVGGGDAIQDNEAMGGEGLSASSWGEREHVAER